MTFNYDAASNEMIESVTIAINTALSGAVVLGNRRPRGLAVQTPAEWTAADIGLEVSNDGETFIKLYDEFGNRVKIAGVATSAAGVYAFPATAWIAGPFSHFKLASLNTSTGANVNQAAARTLKVVMLV